MLHLVSPYVVEFAPGVGVAWYSISYLLSFALGWWTISITSRLGYFPLNKWDVDELVGATCLFGVYCGGRLGYLFLYYSPDSLKDAAQFLFFSRGGMSSHGGILGVGVTLLAYSQIRKKSFLRLTDSITLVAPAGIFLGRCANFINGELYGRPFLGKWAVLFPREWFQLPDSLRSALLQKSGLIDSPPINYDTLRSHIATNPIFKNALSSVLSPRHPSQIYEAVFEGLIPLIFAWLALPLTKNFKGLISVFFLFYYSIARIFLEFFREPDASLILGFSRGQIYSIFTALLGLTVLCYSTIHNNKCSRAKTQSQNPEYPPTE